MSDLELSGERMIVAHRIAPALDEEGGIALVLYNADDSVIAGLYVGCVDNAQAIMTMLAACIETIKVPDDARELTACPTPRDVFGGRSRP